MNKNGDLEVYAQIGYKKDLRMFDESKYDFYEKNWLGKLKPVEISKAPEDKKLFAIKKGEKNIEDIYKKCEKVERLVLRQRKIILKESILNEIINKPERFIEKNVNDDELMLARLIKAFYKNLEFANYERATTVLENIKNFGYELPGVEQLKDLIFTYNDIVANSDKIVEFFNNKDEVNKLEQIDIRQLPNPMISKIKPIENDLERLLQIKKLIDNYQFEDAEGIRTSLSNSKLQEHTKNILDSLTSFYTYFKQKNIDAIKNSNSMYLLEKEKGVTTHIRELSDLLSKSDYKAALHKIENLHQLLINYEERVDVLNDLRNEIQKLQNINEKVDNLDLQIVNFQEPSFVFGELYQVYQNLKTKYEKTKEIIDDLNKGNLDLNKLNSTSLNLPDNLMQILQNLNSINNNDNIPQRRNLERLLGNYPALSSFKENLKRESDLIEKLSKEKLLPNINVNNFRPVTLMGKKILNMYLEMKKVNEYLSDGKGQLNLSNFENSDLENYQFFKDIKDLASFLENDSNTFFPDEYKKVKKICKDHNWKYALGELEKKLDEKIKKVDSYLINYYTGAQLSGDEGIKNILNKDELDDIEELRKECSDACNTVLDSSLLQNKLKEIDEKFDQTKEKILTRIKNEYVEVK